MVASRTGSGRCTMSRYRFGGGVGEGYLGNVGWGKGIGEAGYDPIRDLNGHSVVDVSELLILAGNWGT